MGRNLKKIPKKMISYSPLRYPGGKNKLVKYFKNLIEKNDLKGCVYVEPYSGGASVALSLVIDGYASQIIINDIDRSIYAFWYSVLNYTKELCSLIKKTPVSIETWRAQKEIQQTKDMANILDLGFSTLFLNRTNRSGILTGGVIGGISQDGKWKINARYKKMDIIRRIKKIAAYRTKISLYNLDAIELIEMLKLDLSYHTLIYLDPPYYTKGKQLYLNHYLDKDHRNIAKTIKQIEKQKWVMTYDDNDFIRKLYRTNKKMIYYLPYSAGIFKKGQELMIFSPNLKILHSP